MTKNKIFKKLPQPRRGAAAAMNHLKKSVRLEGDNRSDVAVLIFL